MQLLEIILFGRGGPIRRLSLKPGSVNVITGRSHTGKSALVAVIDYCLGRESFTVPDGVIRDKVSAYGLILQLRGGQALIVRWAPTPPATSSIQVYTELGAHVEPRPLASISPNTNVAGLTQWLGEAIGMSANRTDAPAGGAGRTERATFRHSVYYLFQPQSIIANKDLLFYRQSEDFMPMAMKDTLPYFLGAADDDRIRRLEELREARRRLRVLEQRLAEERAVTGEGRSRALSLAAEAASLGMIASLPNQGEDALVLSGLSEVTKWTPKAIPYPETNPAGELQERLRRLQESHREMRAEIEAAVAFSTHQGGFSIEVSEQRARLKSLGLLREDQPREACPLCNHELGEDVPRVAEIRESLQSLDVQLRGVEAGRPQLDGYIAEKRTGLATVEQQLAQAREALGAAIAIDRARQARMDDDVARARLAGRIGLFLESRAEMKLGPTIATEVLKARQAVEALEQLLANEEANDRLSSILEIVGKRITKWAEDLKLEHAGAPITFDMNRLTIVAHTRSGVIPLARMGSGENWLAYHLATLLALHQWFVEEDRPVPHFLVLDQPSQVYFPPDSEQDTPEHVKAGDREAVLRVFKWVFQVVSSLAPRLQVIVTDHANLNEPWFQECIVESWWDPGAALVPEAWPAAPAAR